jgi:hypothetical protein
VSQVPDCCQIAAPQPHAWTTCEVPRKYGTLSKRGRLTASWCFVVGSTFWYESAYIGNGMMGAMLTLENETCGCPLVCDPTCRCPNADGGRACLANYCNQSACPITDPSDPSQHVAKNSSDGAFVCPATAPLCIGYTYGKHMGSCISSHGNTSARCLLWPGAAPGTAKLRLDVNRVDGKPKVHTARLFTCSQPAKTMWICVSNS